jgi:putative ABC transport system permease protein
LLVCCLTALLFGSIQAFVSWRADPSEFLKEGGKASRGDGRGSLQGALIVAEIALSLVLLASAGLMMRSFAGLQRVSPGFRSEGVMTLGVDLPARRYPAASQIERFSRSLEQRLRALPGVEELGITNALPLTGEGPQTNYAWDVASEKRTDLSADWYSITPKYFNAIGTRLLAGRFFTDTDDASHPRVVIVDETLARHAWPHENAIGKKLMLFSRTENDNRWYEVVGVVEHIRPHDLRRDIREQIYNSNQQEPDTELWAAVKMKGQAHVKSQTLESEVAKLDPQLAIRAIRPLVDYVSDAQAPMRFSLALIAVFGGVALLLAGVGVYAVVGYSVSQRTHEIGIRTALGAQTWDTLRLVLAEEFRLALVGVGLGLAAALALTRFLSSQLFSVSSTDPLSFAGVAILVALVALAACYIPARRAMKVDPMVALRYE